MSDLHKTLACLLVLCFAVAFSFGGSVITNNLVFLPIEVLGTDGHEETITINATDVSNVNRIWFYTYSQGDPTTRDMTPKMQVRVNGSSWIDVANDNASVEAMSPESDFGGVEGVWPSVRWYVNLSGTDVSLNDGENTVTFRVNWEYEQLGTSTANVSSGYYVLGLAFLNASDPLPQARTFDANGEAGGDAYDFQSIGAIDGTTLQYRDPMVDAKWGMPSGYDDKVSEGETLWSQNDLLVDFPGGSNIHASCANCHGQNGEDIQAFGFSNESIVARSQFHELSEEQGLKIAAYIRSVSSRSDIVSWPWQPPYQPGPEITSPNPECDGLSPDSAPEKCWQAGAGMEWILENDAQLRGHLFPDGVSGDAGMAVASTTNTINLRGIPISMPYPDWNEWLPRTHPFDATSWSRSEFTNHKVWEKYASGELDDQWEIAIGNWESRPDKAPSTMQFWWANHSDFAQTHVPKRGGPNNEKLGYFQWKAVKTWEIMRKRETYADEIYDTPIRDVNENLITNVDGEPRSWVGSDRTVFDVAPHINKARIYGPDGSTEDTFFDSQWYDLQMVLNAGNRHAIVIRPMDWKYHLQHQSGVGGEGRRVPYQYARSYLKQNQQLDTGDAPETEDQGLADWHWRHVTHRFLLDRRGPATVFSEMPSSDRASLLTTILRAYMDRIQRVPATTDGNNCSVVGGTCPWERDNSDSNDLPLADINPSDVSGTFLDDVTYVEHFYVGTQWLADQGVRASVISDMYSWAAKMWPKGNDESVMGTAPTWDALNPCRSPNKSSDCSAPTSDEHQIQLQAGWNLISSHVQPENPDLNVVFSDIIDDLVLVKNEVGSTFMPSYSINTIGDWDWRDGYMVYVTQDRTLTLNGSLIDPSTALTVDEGWNLVPYFPDTSMPVADAFADLGSSLVIVKDYAGNSYIPEVNVDDIESVYPGQGYKVYVNSSSTMSYPSNKFFAIRPSSKTHSTRGVSSSATLVIEAPQMEDDAILIARTQNGDEVGRGIVRSGTAALNIIGDDPLTESVREGATQGTRLSVMAIGSDEERPVEFERVSDMLTGKRVTTGLVYTHDAILVADALEESVSFELQGNAPNPVRTTTSITFSVPESVPVRIELYNMLGQRVSTLVDDSYSRGTHKVTLNASTYSSGVYFYRIRAGDFSASRKMTIIR